MVSIYYGALLSIFAIVMLLIVVDPNVGMYLDLKFRQSIIELKRYYYIITLGTVIKYQNWKMKQEFKKIQKEFGKNNE
jgi:hypothetical protein